MIKVMKRRRQTEDSRKVLALSLAGGAFLPEPAQVSAGRLQTAFSETE